MPKDTEELDLGLLDPSQNPWDINEWHSFGTGFLIGAALWWTPFAVIGFTALDWFFSELHYFAFGFFLGSIVGFVSRRVLGGFI